MPFVVERLRPHRKDQISRRLELGEAWNDTHGEVVCDRGDGRPIDPDRFKSFRVTAPSTGCILDVLPADSAGAYGLRVDFGLVDEL